jgi:hypothetical protein
MNHPFGLDGNYVLEEAHRIEKKKDIGKEYLRKVGVRQEFKIKGGREGVG